MDGVEAKGILVRSFKSADQAACVELYRDGLLGGQLAENDTGLDIDDIEMAYIQSPGSHFWVAEDEATKKVVGMIGVQQHDEGVGEIRRLRVCTEHRRRGIGSMLLQKALEFCRDRNYLKVTLDTFIDRDPALKLFEKFNFRHEKTRESSGKQLLYFYLDLYGSEKRR
ncbi:MAG: GNAT family N-acetyltransferase [Tepidisphaeraceae bacterium]